jgi:nitroreductase
MPNLPPGVYHYDVHAHALERRGEFEAALPAGSLVVGLTTIHWREAWKYGERAFRYCQHDIGHAIAAMRYAAATLGWSATLVDSLTDHDLAALLGTDRTQDFAHVDPADREHPAVALLVCVGNATNTASTLDSRRLVSAARRGTWTGLANALSSSHVDWPVISDVAEATTQATARTDTDEVPGEVHAPPLSGEVLRSPAATVIRRRRSAIDFDGESSIAASTFYAMLDHLLPRPRQAQIPPWDVFHHRPRVHALVFVHRVRGLPAGLYAFERSGEVHDALRAALAPRSTGVSSQRQVESELLWRKPNGCPSHLRLFLLREGDLRQAAQIVSCHQAIAADGVFSLGMVAEFGGPVRTGGAHVYRELFWEAGVLGHVLYLEAEAASVEGAPLRATGIGCYFDDVFHELIGRVGDSFQSLYHLAVGAPLDDPRITTLRPYAHRGGRTAKL